jgi:hypothetical protein
VSADSNFELKRRFVEESGDRIQDPERLLRLARACRRRELVTAARDSTLPERRLREAVGALREVGASSPAALLQATVANGLLAAAFGPNRTEWLKARLSRALPEPPDARRARRRDREVDMSQRQRRRHRAGAGLAC